MATMIQNSKFEIRNSKHIFEFGKLEIKYCVGFRASDFGFVLTGRYQWIS